MKARFRRFLPGALFLLEASSGLLLAACSGGSTGPGPPESIIAVALARRDETPVQNLHGYLVFFYDPNQERFLSGTIQINDLTITETLEPGAIPGPLYFRGSVVRAGEAYSIVATIDGPDGPIPISSTTVVAPSTFEILDPPDVHPLGQPLTVTWEAVGNAEFFNVTVFDTGYEAQLPGTATSFTIPASAFAGLTAGQTPEIEVTAFNRFYISLASGIGSVSDAEAIAQRFAGSENITGQGVRGALGASTTVGFTVTLQ
jgi:hypothetical protein